MKIAASLALFLTISVYLIAGISTAQPVLALTASESGTSTTPPRLEIDRLEDKLEKIRDEQYQHAVKIADQSGQKADRLLNWLSGFATIFGFIILVITFTIGKIIFDSLKELRAHARAAKKSAQVIEDLAIKAQQKGDQLVAEISEIKSLKEELTHSKDKTKEQELKLTSVLNQAQSTILEIQALKNSATLVSGATLSYPPYGNITVTEPIGPFNDDLTKKCRQCGVSLQSNIEGYVSYGDPNLCFACKMGASG